MNASVFDRRSYCQKESLFISVTITENIAGADSCMIRTAAARNDNPEIAAARELGIPVFERAQAWGIIMKSYQNAICVCRHPRQDYNHIHDHPHLYGGPKGSHRHDRRLSSSAARQGHRVGGGDTIIMESCEYCNSFLNFFPTTAVVLNIEADHLDFFAGSYRMSKRSFFKFASLVSRQTATLWPTETTKIPSNTLYSAADPITFGTREGNTTSGA